MKDRLLRGRRDSASPPDEDGVGYDAAARRLEMSGRGDFADETDPAAAWDAPVEGRGATDEDAGGAPWDLPGDEQFAPPPPRDVHWAFRARDGDAPTWPAPDDRYGTAAHDDVRAWDADGDGLPGPAADGPWSWEDARSLVTAGGGPRTEVPRDPAQPGLFDPYDAFAPVIADDGWTLPSRPARPTAPITAQDPVPGRAPVPLLPGPSSGDRISRGESVFGDLFAPAAGHDMRVRQDDSRRSGEGERVVAVEATRHEESGTPSATPGVDSPPTRPDPRDWPPIPSGLLPPIPQPAGSGPATPSAEPDGRRFAWPPPQPRISGVSTVTSDDARPLPALDEPTLWSRDRDQLDAALESTPRDVSAAAAPGRPPITLKVVAVAALALAVLVLAAQFVVTLLR